MLSDTSKMIACVELRIETPYSLPKESSLYEIVLKVRKKLLCQESNSGPTFHPSHRLELPINFL